MVALLELWPMILEYPTECIPIESLHSLLLAIGFTFLVTTPVQLFSFWHF